jgi:hypothetical protein
MPSDKKCEADDTTIVANGLLKQAAVSDSSIAELLQELLKKSKRMAELLACPPD